MQRIVVILFFFTFLAGVGQNETNTVIKPIAYSGNLSGYLAILTEQTAVDFSYKSKVIKKKSIKISTACSTLSDALFEIKQQCALDYNRVGAAVITLYPLKGRYIVGTVLNEASSERVVDAIIQFSESETSVSTNKDGNFRLYCLQDSADLVVYHSDYQLLKFRVHVSESSQYFFNLKPIGLLKEVKVVNIDSIKRSTTAFDEVNPSAGNMVAVGGEADAMAHIKLIPGVQNVSFGQQGLTIRGGSPDQNFTLLDGVPVYNTYHLLGLFSIFNAASINSIKLHKDAFPAKYTNRLSSVIDVSLKNGNKQKTEMEMDIGILSSGLYVNGPIIKEKVSYSASVRRTYADLLTLPLQQIVSPNNTSRLWSYDLMGKVHWQLNESNDISMSGYNGGDQLNFSSKLDFENQDIEEERTEGSLGWRNTVLGAKWNSRLGSRVEIHTDVSISGYTLKFSDEYSLSNDSNSIYNSSSYRNGLQEIRVGIDADVQWNKSNKLTIGLGAVEYLFRPFERGYTSITATSITDTNLISRQLLSSEQFVFAENKSYFKGGNITYGLRVSAFSAQGTNYMRFQPKIHLIQNIKSRQQLRFSMTVSNQFVHLVPNNNLGLPVDIWLPVTQTLKPMGVTQFSTKYMLKQKTWVFETGVFSKFYSNILEHESGTQLLSEANWENNLKVGSGRSYGLEIAARMKLNGITSYASYTYSRSKRNVLDINNDLEYFSKFDRPHIINLLGEYHIKDNLKVLATWSFASGNPITVPVARYITQVGDQEFIIEEYGDINNYRLPSTHHLDISVIKDKEHKRFHSTFTFGVYNIYNRLNPFMAFIGLDENANPQLRLRSYLPILPTFKYSIKL